MAIVNSVEKLIGATPVIKLKHASYMSGSDIFGKCEFMNPNGSVKDRIAFNMLETALEEGSIDFGTTIIEPTSGNTGIALASICASKGLKLILTMPDSMSKERRDLLRAFGAKLELTPAKEGMKGTIKKANELQAQTKNSIILQQFENMNNPKAHEKSTAKEIIEDFGKELDIFVAGIGTGGSISGVGRVLKEYNPKIKIYGIEPSSSAVIAGNPPAPHKIQGIGAGFIPKTLDTGVIDEMLTVNDTDAAKTAREIAQKEGLLVGISSGANVFTAQKLGEMKENRGKKILTFLCDTGERYLSCNLFS